MSKLNDFITPDWIKEIDPGIKLIALNQNVLAAFTGTLLGLLDYCRQHMPAEDWQYVLGQIRKETVI